MHKLAERYLSFWYSDEYIQDKVKWPSPAKAIDEFFKNSSKDMDNQDDLSKKFYYIKT